MIIAGYWVGPDVDDGWGYVEAFVNPITWFFIIIFSGVIFEIVLLFLDSFYLSSLLGFRWYFQFSLFHSIKLIIGKSHCLNSQAPLNFWAMELRGRRAM